MCIVGHGWLLASASISLLLATALCSQNSELGAEEAFKILHHAFEMIGEPVSNKFHGLFVYVCVL